MAPTRAETKHEANASAPPDVPAAGWDDGAVTVVLEVPRARPAEERKSLGAVYTPRRLAEWVAAQLVESSLAPLTTVLDPAVGAGALLEAARAVVPDCESIVGVDLSATALAEVQESGGAAVTTVHGDALLLEQADLPPVKGVIMNPPWGAETRHSRTELRAAGYTLATGQYDSWDLFVEWSVRRTAPGTVVAAILPDALLLPEHTATRRLLLDQTSLRVVARLGEGWFPGVYRGVVVVVYVVGPPEPDATVRCLRLPYDARRDVLKGRTGLAEAARPHWTVAAQRAWSARPDAPLLAGVVHREGALLERFEERGGAWTSWVLSGRGVELGKHGRLLACRQCGWHVPRPKVLPDRCTRCGAPDALDAVTAVERERPGDGAAWVPLVTGEDVQRYVAAPSRWLRLGLAGVNYKSLDRYAGNKLLVRKTGLGLHAAVDRTGSLTTQVVLDYRRAPGTPDFALDYLQGVLCSRVLLAYHLRRSGETEWRSHPYVTPRSLATLPVPLPAPGTAEWRQALAIAEASRAVTSSPDRRTQELVVERLVAGLFHLSSDDCEDVCAILARAQQLLAFRPLQVAAAELRPVLVT